eukprot:3490820-Prymnesium_polylepis.2
MPWLLIPTYNSTNVDMHDPDVEVPARSQLHPSLCSIAGNRLGARGSIKLAEALPKMLNLRELK